MTPLCSKSTIWMPMRRSGLRWHLCARASSAPEQAKSGQVIGMAPNDGKHYNNSMVLRGTMADSPTRLPQPPLSANTLDHVVGRLRLIGQMERGTIHRQ